MDQTNYNISSSNQESLNQQKTKKKSGLKVFGILILIIVLMTGSAYAGYWYREQKAKKELQSANQQIADLQKQKQELEEAKAKQEKENEEEKKASTTTATVPSEEVKTNIQDAVKSGNVAALEGYMASPVKVILAASEGLGDRTPEQAVTDMKYLNSGTDPWDFSLPETTLSQWQTGPYKQYFPSNAVVGKSANGYVVSFSFNGDGKISAIFMTSDDNLLQ